MNMDELVNMIARKNALISSPAGAGKTDLLVKIFLEQIRSGIDFNDIVAITFTNKAAGEMKERIISELLKGGDAHREVLEKYFSGSYRLRVSTIHSFLNSLLEVVVPGLAFSGSMLYEKLAEKIFKKIARETLSSFHNGKRTDQAFTGRVFRLAGEGDIVMRLMELFKRAPLSFFWSQEIRNLPEQDALKRLGSPSVVEIYKDVSVLFGSAYLEYLQWKITRGYVEHSDIEYFSYLFVNAETEERDSAYIPDWRDLLLYFNENFDVMLIDEFQDTSKLEWEIINFLVRDRLSGKGLGEAKKSLIYLVGDPKQSIYAFRNADVSVMQSCEAEFEHLEKEAQGDYKRVKLEVNKRSSKPIVDTINALFSKLMHVESEDAPLWKTRYEPFTAERDKVPGLAEFVLFPELSSNDERAKQEAVFIANEISKLIEEGALMIDKNGQEKLVSFKDIAIILRAKTHLAKYENELSLLGIPYVTVGGDYVSNKCFDFLRTFFIAAGRPMENGYVIKMLSSLGVEIASSVSAGLWSLRGKEGVAHDLYLAFIGYNECFMQAPLPAFGRAMKILEPVARTLASEVETRQAFRLMEEIFAEADKTGVSSPYEMADFLLSMPSDTIPELSVEGNAVNILTIHKAKGLEYPVVFAAGLWSGATANTENFVLFPGKNNSLCEIAFGFPMRGRNSTSEDFSSSRREVDAYFEKEKKVFSEFIKEEEKRLLYVALTRARDRLYVMLPEVDKKIAYSELYELVRTDPPASARIVMAEEEVYDRPLKKASLKYATEWHVDERYNVDGLFNVSGIPGGLVKKCPLIFERKAASFIEERGMRIGTIVHALLYELAKGYMSADEIKERASELSLYYYAEDEYADEAAELVEGFFTTPHFRKYFVKESEPEVSFLVIGEDGYSIKRPDLILEKKTEIEVIDYKTDRELETDTSKATYLEQIDAYLRAVSEIYPDKKTKGVILFLRSGEVIEI